MGCWGDDPTPPNEGTPPILKGEPLELNDTAPAKAGECPQCTKAAGPAHVCEHSVWCAKCSADATAESGVHVCNVSHFCAQCGFEAAIAGHRCGESSFNRATLAYHDFTMDQAEDDE